MDYLERLEKSITDFENGNEKLSKIPELISEIVKLIEEVQEEKRDTSEKMAILDQLKIQIREQGNIINDMLEKEKKISDEFVTTMTSTLIQRTQEHINVYNSLSSNISITENNLNAKIVNGNNHVVERVDAVEKGIDKCFFKLKSMQVLIILSIMASILSCVMGVIL